jgi:hypothetical protein
MRFTATEKLGWCIISSLEFLQKKECRKTLVPPNIAFVNNFFKK